MAERCDDTHGVAEFALGQAHLPHKTVQVPNQRQQDLAQPRVFDARKGFFHRLRHVSLIFDDHGRFPRSLFR